MQSKNLGVFIDEANIYHSQKTLSWKVDYLKLKKYLSKMGHIKVLNFYTSYQNTNSKQQKFLDKLKDFNYTVFTKKLKIIESNGVFIKKGNLDIELAVDAYRLKNEYDTIVLFSGDSDFDYLLKLLKDENKNIIVISTAEHISRELIKTSHKYIELKKLKKSCKKIN
jgi:uncharacterized LabA/DUF88 family protein